EAEKLEQLKKQQAAEAERLARLKKEQEAAERKRQEEEKRLAQLEAKRKAEEAERKRLAEEAEKKRKAEEAERKRLAEEAEKKRLAAEAEKKRLAEEAEKKRLAAEAAARQAAAEAQRIQGVVDQYTSMIQQRVTRNWIKPGTARPGMSCKVAVTLVPGPDGGGEVVNARVIQSSGDPVFDRSAEVAVFKASPLPLPADPAVFERFREFQFRFKPE